MNKFLLNRLLLCVFIALIPTKVVLCGEKVVTKTPGRPFPMPQFYKTTNISNYLNKQTFLFHWGKGSYQCEIITQAFVRYYDLIFEPQNYQIVQNYRNQARKLQKKQNKNSLPFRNNFISGVTVTIESACETYPTLDSDESYTLNVSSQTGSIVAKSVWGVLRGLETFTQLVIEQDDGAFSINDTYIEDFPRFQHRGILVDTSRHFIHKSILKQNLEAMSANKLNVFHWHIVDDQSFPFQSASYPDLSDNGAWDPFYHIYTYDDVQEIIEYARLRGIRVIAEFDTPGHTLSWEKSILTSCYSGSTKNGQYGPIDPSNNSTYEFLYNFIQELTRVFPDKYLHLGGDEVSFDCWKSNPDITNFMKQMGFGNDYGKLEQYYEQNLLNIVNKVNPSKGYIIWQDVIDNSVTLKPDTVVEVWRDPWPQEMAQVTKYGYRTLLSTCWYLDYISYGSDWIDYYKCEPLDFNGTDSQKALVIGGEACLWSEYVDGSNLISRMWPRASAVAERLWSSANVTDINDASNRIEENRCRMIRRGIRAEPFDGPGYCNYEIEF